MKRWSRSVLKGGILFFLTLFVLLSLGYCISLHYKKELLVYFQTEFETRLHGKIKIGDFSFTLLHPFPHLTITLKNVEIQDSVSNTALLKAEKVFLQLHLLKLLTKEIEIKSTIVKNADLYVYKDCTGYLNSTALKSRTSTPLPSNPSHVGFSIKDFLFENVSFLFRDDQKGKVMHLELKRLHTKLELEEAGVNYRMKGTVYTKGLLFNSVHGAFLANKEVALDLHLAHTPLDSIWAIHPSILQIEDVTYHVTGKSNLSAKQQIVELQIKVPNADYDKAISILSDHLRKPLSKFQVKNGLSCQVTLLLPLQRGMKPQALVHFQLKNSTLSVLGQNFEHTYLAGSFTNRHDSLLPINDANSIVEVDHAQFYYHGLVGTLQGTLHDLTLSKLKVKGSVQGPLTVLDSLMDTTHYRFKSGTFTTQVTYDGPLKLKGKITALNAHIEGDVRIEKGQLEVVEKGWDISSIQSSFHFNESDMVLSRLSCTLNKNPLEITSNMKGIVPFLLFPRQQTKVQLSMSSPHFDINRILRKTNQLMPKKENSKPFMDHLYQIGKTIDIHANVDLRNTTYKKLFANEVTGILELNKNEVALKNWNILLSKGGRIHMIGKYTFEGRNQGVAYCKATLSQLDASNLFYGFSNFGQQTLRYEHLKGKLNATMDFQCQLNESFDPVRTSMQGRLSILLEKGALNKFEPLSHLDGLVFKHRNLDHIIFDTISNEFALKGDEIYIQKMQVSSSALSLFLEGTYSFRNKTDLSIQIPLANLKGNKEEFYHLKENQHGNIRLRAKEKNGKMTVSLDLFDRFHKKEVTDTLKKDL